VRWEQQADRFVLKVTIPANTTATVHLPLLRPDAAVYESELEAERSPGVKLLRRQSDRAVFEIESGSYVFESR
ncbi:MAG TPA: alpha-L-rhamnosidase C-terminal domain-containing protein, partial [Tepidisphaeraceae bacterium]|nr:alpha-L-rhamnosidase C-terminal domain-containing protein [Tepidisphaeraceae bacterium]